ncbi:MAG: hypothetical protein LBJ37_01055 [Paucimonas sp.]|jgi:hypothetical protein|nr:hypothetical protein [Paucimonas sp.]
MRYYRNIESGQTYAFAADGSDDAFIPEDYVLMTDTEVQQHLNPAPVASTRAEVEVLRLRAYADPLTGSDRYFAEAQRESLLENAEAAEAAKHQGLMRFLEIQAEFPWPDEPVPNPS